MSGFTRFAPKSSAGRIFAAGYRKCNNVATVGNFYISRFRVSECGANEKKRLVSGEETLNNLRSNASHTLL